MLQAAATPGDVAANLAALDAAAGRAAARGADLLVTPELFPTGYAPGEVAPDDSVLPAVRATAARHGLALVVSEPHEGHITAVAVAADGEPLGRHVKTHLWGAAERSAFTPGDGTPVVVDVAGLRVGLAVCYDVEFPEVVRGLALAGADVVCVPTAVDDPDLAEVLVRARAYENRVALAYANHVGPLHGGGTFCGGSVVVGPDGRVLARASADAEDLLIADVDAGALAAARATVDYLADRRPETYAGLSAPTTRTP